MSDTEFLIKANGHNAKIEAFEDWILRLEKASEDIGGLGVTIAYARAELDRLKANFRAERRVALRELQRANLGASVQVGSPADVKRRAELEAEEE